MPSPAAARAHCRVNGAVGHATRTQLTTSERSCSRANSRAGRVLPAPGAADSRNGPLDHSDICESAPRCQPRSAEGFFEGRAEEALRESELTTRANEQRLLM